jgi:DNA-directed RNA polymerase specialized sigma24 family protein
MEHSVTCLLEILQSHDDSHVQHQIWQRYYSRLVNCVASRLDRKFCGTADEDDVVLSAMHSFFDGVAEGRFPRLDDRDSFWNLLLTIAYRKAIKQNKHAMRLKRGAGRILNETAFRADDGDSALESPIANAESSPTEEEIAVAAEQMTEGLGDEVLRQIVFLKLQGYTDKEVAGKLGVVEKTIARKRDRIKAIWSADESGGAPK